ncbi:MAG: outer membrane protein assembly factor BamD [Alphaproteobacteria bacterium]|nr:outer membrane protein assembly factor BamD [Alphaproteobacteria bacterium]MAS46934.1 outer membrane protein assembly factor BamD [Alphaproteobacteria bacterium]MAX95028.1 outer membrane protein assembly factor BamD [Alphaproteobacteria bacterium]MBN53516.1 outer membrane protein assembly factor BamD [Alphaproteobacteria bacterium]OUT41509.1 MAG: outer membrane protein assembly factor BamD [Micavibrio sp. TMED2]|tara:strand:+ start:15720 stop:16568 length:849 start_codon:yes stop_codon:yes gene_type:complete
MTAPIGSCSGNRFRPILLGLALVLSLAACSSDDEGVAYVERPAEEIYNTAANALDSGRYQEAAQQFDEVERQHPYSEWATRAQLMAGYAYYQDLDYDQAILALERFIQLQPGHKDIAYAYYLRALSYYEQITDVKRDQAVTQQAMDGLRQVFTRFPESKYARDARLKFELTEDHLAGKEMSIGRYYQKRGQYQAAINRYRRVVDEFQTTSHVPEALHRLTESYLALGVVPEAQAAAAVLGYNFPGSDWYEDSYALLAEEGYEPVRPEKGWMARMMDKVANAF